MGSTWEQHVRDTVLLLASEVVTNAVLYGLPPMVLHVTELSAELVLRVTDASTTPLMAPAGGWRMPPAHAAGGRGLPLLQVLAERWGSHLRIDAGGRAQHEVWFSLPRHCPRCEEA